MSVKIPSAISTENRSEMVCPNCFHEGLEPHPGYESEYQGKDEILYATRCPNREEDCKYHFGKGIPESAIRLQYSEPGALEKLSSSVNLQSILVGTFVIVGIIILLNNVVGLGLLPTESGGLGGSLFENIGLGGGGSDITATVSGEIVNSTGEPISNTSIQIVGTEQTVVTDTDGQYEIKNLNVGKHTASIIPPPNSELAASSFSIRILSSGEVETDSSLSGPKNELILEKPVSIKKTIRLGDSAATVDFENPVNAEKDGIKLIISPPPEKEITDSLKIETGKIQNQTLSGILTKESVTVRGEITTEKRQIERRWTGANPLIFGINGSLTPKDISVSVSEESNNGLQVVEKTVNDGDSFEIDVNGEIRGQLEAKIGGGSSSTPIKKTGQYEGKNPTVTIDEKDGPSTVTFSVAGSDKTLRKTTTGSASGDVASFELEGTQKAKNVIMTFNGGTLVGETLSELDISANGRDGFDETRATLFEAPESGNYKMQLDFIADRNKELVTGKYIINGQETTIPVGETQENLNLLEGDFVEIEMKATRETFSKEKNYTRTTPVKVIEQTVSKASVEKGDPVTVEVTMKNTGSNPYSAQVNLFKDGEKYSSANKYFSVGETKTFSAGEVVFANSGTHTVSVNEGQKNSISVGSGTPKSGAGTISGTITRVDSQGTINIDTKNDGAVDCSVSASGGSCAFETLQAGENRILLSQDGVKNVNFDISYIAQYGPSDVTVDINNDGQPEITQTGALGSEPLTGTATLATGDHPIKISVGNGQPLNYTASWTQSGTVEKPRMYIDDDIKIDSQINISGSQTYSIPSITPGKHTVRFESANESNSFNAQLKWSETSENSYPSTYLNGKQVCASTDFSNNQLRCGISTREVNLDSSNEITFESGSTEYNYTVEYTARSIPETVIIENKNKQLQIFRQNADTRYRNGTWEQTIDSTNILEKGTNQIQLRTSKSTDLVTKASGTVQYTYKAKKPRNPVIKVTNKKQTNSRKIPNKALEPDGTFTRPESIVLPAEWFEIGKNRITLQSDNSGTATVTLNIRMAKENKVAKSGL